MPNIDGCVQLKMMEALEALSYCESMEEFRSVLCEQMCTIVPFDGALVWFLGRTTSGKTIRQGFTSGQPDFTCIQIFPENRSHVDAFNEHYWKLQPRPPPGIGHVHAIDWRLWSDTEFYDGFVRPLGVQHSLVPIVDSRYCFTVHRLAGSPFNIHNTTTMEIFSCRLSDVYGLLSRYEELRQFRAGKPGVRMKESTSIHFTPRERQIIELLSMRLNAGEVAAALRISRRTVEQHIYDLYEKLHVYDRHGLLQAAIETVVS